MKFKFYTQYFLKSLSLYGPGVLTLVLAYFILINLSQGRDVVMQVGESMSSFISLVPAVLLWAFFLWYSSRLLGYEKKFNDAHWPLNFLSTFPRVLAYNAFVSVQAAILSLPTILDWGFWSILIFICVHNAYYFFLTHAFGTERKRFILIPVIAVAIAYVFTLWIIHYNQSAHQYFLPLVVMLLFLFQLGTLFFFVRRRVRIDKKAKSDFPDDAVDYVTLFTIRVIKLPAWFKAYEQQTFIIFNIVSAIAIGWYITLFNSISIADKVGPLAVVLLAFGILAGLANIITHQSMRLGINLFLILLFIAIGLGKISDPYEVELTKATAPNQYATRPTFDAYLKKWVTTHQAAIDSADSYPVYFVLADGGASRSGYWVASVLAAWQDESIKQNKTDPFSDHLLCLSGASGGSVGNATFYSLLKFPPSDNQYLTPAQAFLGQDFLTYSIAHYLGPDLARHFIIGFRATDRAAAISHTLDYWGERHLNNAFSKNVNELLDSTGRLPMLFINVTQVQEGTPSVVSSVQLTGLSDRLDILKLVDSTYYSNPVEGNISFSTATMLGARFPYISPAGSIKQHAFVDGGYFDNSGAGMVHEVLQAMKKLKETTSDDSLRSRLQKLNVRIVHITNSPKSEPIKPIHPLINDLAAPLLTVFNTYNAQTEVNDRRLESFLRDYCNCNDGIKQINLYEHEPNETYPMNWVISDYQREKMNARLERVCTKEIKELLEQD